MMRRSFSSFDSSLRRRLMQRLSQSSSTKRISTTNITHDDASIGANAFKTFLPLLNQLVELPE